MEALLNLEGELVITKGSKPIAKMVTFQEEPDQREPFDFDAHCAMMDEIIRENPEMAKSFDEELQESREDRDW